MIRALTAERRMFVHCQHKLLLHQLVLPWVIKHSWHTTHSPPSNRNTWLTATEGWRTRMEGSIGHCPISWLIRVSEENHLTGWRWRQIGQGEVTVWCWYSGGNSLAYNERGSRSIVVHITPINSIDPFGFLVLCSPTSPSIFANIFLLWRDIKCYYFQISNKVTKVLYLTHHLNQWENMFELSGCGINVTEYQKWNTIILEYAARGLICDYSHSLFNTCNTK